MFQFPSYLAHISQPTTITTSTETSLFTCLSDGFIFENPIAIMSNYLLILQLHILIT